MLVECWLWIIVGWLLTRFRFVVGVVSAEAWMISRTSMVWSDSQKVSDQRGISNVAVKNVLENT